MLTSSSRGDDTDNLFAIAILLSTDMGNQQNQCGARLRARRADRMPSLLAILIHAVKTDKAPLILKHLRRQLEGDAVLPLVLAVLSFVPLIPHLYIHIV